MYALPDPQSGSSLFISKASGCAIVFGRRAALLLSRRIIALLDESILNEGSRPVDEGGTPHLRRLAVNLSMQLQRKFSVRELVLPIFKEIHYPDDETIAAVDEELIALAEKTALRRPEERERGDCLFSGTAGICCAIDAYRDRRLTTMKDTNDAARRFVPGGSLAQHRLRLRSALSAGGSGRIRA
jgi:hypothetical protein